MGDYSASQGIDYATNDYPGDMYHYARFRIAMAARSAGIDAVDGPYLGGLTDVEGYKIEALKAKSLGMVGKWAIHPAQIAPALEVFSPKPEDVARARKWQAAYEEAEAKGLGAAQVDGVMIDVAVLRIVRNTLDAAELYGL